MAKSSFNFRMVLGLDSTKFSKSLKSAEAQMQKFKATVLSFAGAMGAGLGFASLAGKLKDTVVELSVAQATLRNTFMNSTAGMKEYGDVNEWLTNLANRYKQEIVGMTDSFAKFHAAADAMNVSLDDQKIVFEALTKAATFFHLSGERTQDMMVAVEQMFSKGKVTAEELRRQLGNNLPGAFGIMAKAAQDAGISVSGSTAELEDLMKKGLLPADKVMPAFAKRLNEVTSNIDTNSLQLQLNALSNAWTALAKSTGFEKAFSGMVNGAAKALDSIRNHTTLLIGSFITLTAAISSQKIIKSLSKMVTSTEAYRNSMAQAKQQAQALGNATVGMGAKIVATMKGIGAAIKGVMMSNLITAVIMGLGMIISALADVAKAAYKAKHTYRDMMKEMEEAKHQPFGETETLRSYLKILKETDKTTSLYKDTLAKINDILGLEGEALLTVDSRWEDINKKVEEYAKNMENAAYAEVLASKIAEAKVERAQVYKDIQNGKRVRTNTTKYNQMGLAIQEWEAELKKVLASTVKGSSSKANGGTYTGGGDKTDKDPLYKVLKKFTEDYGELQNKKNSGKVFTGADGLAEYNKELGKIVQTAGEGIYGFKDLDAYLKRLGPTAVKTGEQIKTLYDQWKEENKYDAAVESLTKFAKETEDLGNQYKNGAKTNDEYNTKMNELTVETWEAIAKFGDLTEVFKKLNPELQKLFSEVQAGYGDAKSSLATEKKNKNFTENTFSYERDNRYDFNKKRSAIFEDIHDSWDKLADDVQKEIDRITEKFDTTDSKVKGYLDTLNAKLQVATANAKTLGEAAQLAKWKEVIDELNKEYGENVYGGIKNTAQALDRLRSGYQNLKELMEDDDASAFDVLVGTLNETFQVLDTVMGLMETYNTLREIAAEVEMARNNQELTQMAEKLALQEALNAAIKQQADAEITAAAGAALNAAASTTEASASAGAAIAGATKSGASLPFPYNLAAILAGVAAVVGALAMMSKFATGGIVGGNSKHGDKVLARVNSGEMVLNSGQQSRLWNAIKTGNFGNGGGNVNFKIHGSDLVGVLNNYSKQIKG